MGLFAARPEEPFEWAGLPSEPLEPESEAERLTGGPTLTGLGVGGGISLPLPDAIAQPDSIASADATHWSAETVPDTSDDD